MTTKAWGQKARKSSATREKARQETSRVSNLADEVCVYKGSRVSPAIHLIFYIWVLF
jgi:hypothetical protein